MFFNQCTLLFTVMLMTSAVANAAGALDGSPQTLGQNVREMLKLDAERALLNEQRMQSEEARRLSALQRMEVAEQFSEPPKAESAPVTEKVEPPTSVEVLGIFGIEKKLMADIEINGGRYRYISGRQLPLGVGGDFRYRLVSIKAPCVFLKDIKGDVREACLRSSGL